MKKVDIIPAGEMTYQVRTKSAAMLIEFEDVAKENIFKDIVMISGSVKRSSVPIIKDKLIKLDKYAVEDIDIVIDGLVKYNLFDAVIDNSTSSDTLLDLAISKKIIVIGDSGLSEKIHNLLAESSHRDVTRFTFDTIVNNEHIISEAAFLLVDCICFNPYALRIINRVAVENNIPWLHIGGFENEQIKIGPIFYGKESGCYECLERRKISNLETPEYDQDFIKHLI